MNTRGTLLSVLLITIFSVPAFSGWSEPVPLTVVNDPSGEDWSPFLTVDGLTLYFARVRSSASYYGKICAATRKDISSPFTKVQVLDCPLNDLPGHQLCPWVSCDNLRMYYHNENSGRYRIMLSERKTIDEPWPAGISIKELNSLGNKLQAPSLTQSELIIVFDAYDIPGGNGDYDLWIAIRTDKHSAFTQYRNLSEINSQFDENNPYISPDGLELYFDSKRNGQTQLFRANRNNLDETFKNIVLLSQFDIPGIHNSQPCFSYNGREMFFTKDKVSDRSTKEIYVSYSFGDNSSFSDKLSIESSYEIIDKGNGNE